MTAKREKNELHAVWLDLANAYGSVPHSCIKFALKFFHIPKKMSDVLTLWECFLAFHHHQIYNRLASIESQHYGGLCCLTFAVCYVYGANPVMKHCHCQWWRILKWKCPTTIEGIHGRCNHIRPNQNWYTGATGLLLWLLNTVTDEGQAGERAKYFPCPWDLLEHPFIHMWHLHSHRHGAASQESRLVICLPTCRQTQMSWGTEDCPGGPSRHWEEWASRKPKGMVLPAWPFIPSPLSPAGLWYFSLMGRNNPVARQQVPWQVVGCAYQQLASILQKEFSSPPSHQSQKNSRWERLGSTWFFGTYRMTSYNKYSLKSELEPSGQLLKRC